MRGVGIALMVVSGLAAIWLPESALLWSRLPIAYTFGERGQRQMEQQRRWGRRSSATWRRWWPVIVGTLLLGLALTILGA